jgi:putative flavoprotein involved in K+ transport
MSPLIDTRPDATLDTVVVGAGQAGLALGHYLQRHGRRFAIVDGASRVGQSWRDRWDSLTLFTPRRYDSLPGMPFPGDSAGYPGKDEVADYLESYVHRFDLPVLLGNRVTSVRREPDDGFVVETSGTTLVARQVVVATGGFTGPMMPSFASRLDPDVAQLHSSAYRNPGSLPEGHVVVVGAGNTGVQIAHELAASGRRVTLAVSSLGKALPHRWLGRDLFWWFSRLGTMDVGAGTRIGRRLQSENTIIGTDLTALFQRVARAGRVVDAHGRELLLADGERCAADAVVWATGYRADYPWLDIPVLDADGAPNHRGGITEVEGLEFLGLPWQRNRGSALLGWVGRDAAITAERLGRQLEASPPRPARDVGRVANAA